MCCNVCGERIKQLLLGAIARQMAKHIKRGRIQIKQYWQSIVGVIDSCILN